MAGPALRSGRRGATVLQSGPWTVTSAALAPDDVRVDVARGVVLVSVGDDGADTGQRTSVVLRPDGSLTVQAGVTPPALLVTASQACTVPPVPGTPGTARLDSGQRLLVLSSDALDALPQSLVQVLQALPEQVTGRDPSDLLNELFAGLPGGSGVIVARRPVLAPVPGPDQKEATWGSAQHS